MAQARKKPARKMSVPLACVGANGVAGGSTSSAWIPMKRQSCGKEDSNNNRNNNKNKNNDNVNSNNLEVVQIVTKGSGPGKPRLTARIDPH